MKMPESRETDRGAILGRRARRFAGERGSASVEFALTATLLILMFLGVADFGRAIKAACVVTHASHAGAVFGSQNSANAANISGMTTAASNDAQELPGVAVSASETCKCANGTVVSCTTGTCTGVMQIYVTVSAQYTFQTIFTYPGIPHTVGLGRQTVMRAQ